MNKLYFIFIPFVFCSSCATRLSSGDKENLVLQLQEMASTDQIAASHWEAEWAAYKDSVFTIHKIKAEELFDKYGYLGFNEVGEVGATNFYLLVQHADAFPEFQQRVLVEMDKEVKKGNADSGNYTYLYDRVQVNAGRKQKFGTQIDYDINGTGRAFPRNGLVDSANIDNLRISYGLDSLKSYLNQMTIMHFELNRAHYEGMGLSEPNLYK